MSGLLAVFSIEDRNGQRSSPAGEHRLPELLLTPCLFPVVRENRVVASQEAPHQNQIAVVIHANAYDFQPLRRILLRQFIQHGVLVAARLAPRRPKVHQNRFSTVLLEQFLISLGIDDLWILPNSLLRSLRRRDRSRCPQQYK